MKAKIDNSRKIKQLLEQHGDQPQRAQQIAGLIAQHNCKQLNISADPNLNLSLTPDEWQAICKALKQNSKISDLYIIAVVISNDCAQQIAEIIGHNQHIAWVRLAMNQMGDVAFGRIAVAVKNNTTLKNLEFLDGAQVQAAGASALASSLQDNSTLTELALNFCFKQTPTGPLANILENSRSLAVLRLAGNRLDDGDAEIISQFLASNNSVTELDLGCNRIGPDGMRLIAESLKSNRCLKKLILHNNQIGDEGCETLSGILADNQSLFQLHLEKNQITEVGATKLFVALKTNKTLRFFSCGDNVIGDEGFEPISQALLTNTTLASLYIHGCGFSEASIKRLKVVMQSNRSITSINACDENIDEGLLDSIMQDCARNKANITIGLAVLDYFLMTATRLPSDVRRLIVAYSCPFFNPEYAEKLDDRLRVKPLFLYFNGLYNRIGSISDDHEKGVAFYEFKRQMLAKLDLPGAWRQQFQDLEYSGYMDFYNQLRATLGYEPVPEPRESSCVLM